MNLVYYIIPENDKVDECIDSLITNQNINKKNIVILCDNDISQIFRIPYMQKYQGFACIISTKIKLINTIDINNIINNDECIIKNTDNTFFLINCSDKLIKEKFNSTIIVKNDLRQYLSHNEFIKYYKVNDSINESLKLIPLNKNNNEYLGQQLFELTDEEKKLHDEAQEKKKQSIIKSIKELKDSGVSKENIERYYGDLARAYNIDL